ncbi:hypothetical protein COO60DRAFT_1636588 [Scenedesmus sp. NREL 46B-D3]|nr:hypothetical protein COO60DRAFT_1636588 [Scenedesmus sp. NREL 46B-D3]
MGSSGKSTIKLPRLRTKDELLKMRATAPPAGHTTLSRPGSQRGGQLANYDTPRGFGDEPLTVDQELAIELESVKRERQQLLESISQVKAESGTAGGEAQQADIRQLLKELELKKAKLNELKGDSRKTDAAIAKMRDDDADAQRLTPDDCVEENAYIQSLRDEMTRVEDDLLEADAKNRLYYLLGERTRREHMAIDQKVRDKQDSKRACLEDLANLTEHFNVTRAAKEAAEKELAKTKRQVDEARADWMRKIRERRGEVRELKKRQQKEREKEVKRREKQLDKEKAERATQAKLKMEQEAYQLQVAALAPKIEAMEASWNRLRAISGAETPNEVVEYWQGLKAKEQHMHELVALAEHREAACKSEISQLLASRSAMFQSSKAAAAVVAAAAAAAAEAAAAAAAGPHSADEDMDAVNASIEAAEKRMDDAQVQFNKLRSICVAAEQGLRSLLHRLKLAAEEVAPAGAAAFPPLHNGHPSPTAALQLGAAVPAQRLQLAGASSSTGSHTEAMRRSNGGAAGSSRQGRATRDAVDVTLVSKSNRLGSLRPRDTRSAGSEAPTAAAMLAHFPEGANVSPSGPVSGLLLAGLSGPASGAASAAATSRPMLPSRGKNTIEDDAFFEALPQLLADVTDRLEKLLMAGEGLDLATIKAAAAAAAEGSLLSGSALSSMQPTPRVPEHVAAAAAVVAQAAEAAAAAAALTAAVQEQQAPGEQGSAAEGEAAADDADAAAEDADAGNADAAGMAEEEGVVLQQKLLNRTALHKVTALQQRVMRRQLLKSSSNAAAGAAPAATLAPPAVPGVPAAALAVGGTLNSAMPQSEKALLKGLPRRTWTGAPWLDSVGDNAVDMTTLASMKRKKGKRKEAAAAPDLSRILGYTPPSDVPAESDSDDDDGADDGDGGQGPDAVVDREWIKMRAAKMMARHNAKQAAAAAAAQQGGGRDSHARFFYRALQCFLLDFWDHQECQATLDSEANAQLADLPAAAGGAYCFHLLGPATGRVCMVHSVLGTSLVENPQVAEGGVLPLLHKKFAQPQDIFYINASSASTSAAGDAAVQAANAAAGKQAAGAYQQAWDLGIVINQLANEVLSRQGLPVLPFFNITLPLHDNHASVPLVSRKLDCMHYCHPGVPQMWVWYLFDFLRSPQGVQPLPSEVNPSYALPCRVMKSAQSS